MSENHPSQEFIEGQQSKRSSHNESIPADEGGYYAIKVKGHLSEHWSQWFDDLTILRDERGFTIVSGTIVDQSALHGILARIRDLGLVLVSLSSEEQG